MARATNATRNSLMRAQYHDSIDVNQPHSRYIVPSLPFLITSLAFLRAMILEPLILNVHGPVPQTPYWLLWACTSYFAVYPPSTTVTSWPFPSWLMMSVAQIVELAPKVAAITIAPEIHLIVPSRTGCRNERRWVCTPALG